VQRAVSVVRLALSSIWHSQQKQYIMSYNTVVLTSVVELIFKNGVPKYREGTGIREGVVFSSKVTAWGADRLRLRGTALTETFHNS
jgi:hypothetical protein